MFNHRMLVLLGLALTVHSANESRHEIKIGDEVCITKGKYKGHDGKISRCYPTEQKWGVKLTNGDKVKCYANQMSLILDTESYAAQFEKGDTVFITAAKNYLNYGKFGKISKWLPTKMKWEVKLVKGGETECSANSMELIERRKPQIERGNLQTRQGGRLNERQQQRRDC